MKFHRFGVLFLMLGLVTAMSCTPVPTYIIYVDNTLPCGLKSWDQEPIVESWDLVVFPKDKVVFANVGTVDNEIMFTDDTGTASDAIFGVTTVAIAKNKRAILTVKDDAAGTSLRMSVKHNAGCPSGDPKVKAGEGP